MSPFDSFIVMFGPFLVLAACGWFYKRGQDAERDKQESRRELRREREAREKKIRDRN